MAFNSTLIPPEDVEPLAAQVAGHICVTGQSSYGMLKHKSGYVLKPLRGTKQAENELQFYLTLQSSPYADLQQFTPKFYGTSQIIIGGSCIDVLILEDLVNRVEKPCVMDIKIGKQTWDPYATHNKIEAEKGKYSECKRDLSFCIPGFQVHDIPSGSFLKFGKEYGKRLNKETVSKAFSTFLNFNACENAAKRIIQYYISKLEKIFSILVVQTNLQLYSSSILLIYDGAKFHNLEPGASGARVHMIDFAHAFATPTKLQGRDENYLEGLSSLINVLKAFL